MKSTAAPIRERRFFSRTFTTHHKEEAMQNTVRHERIRAVGQHGIVDCQPKLGFEAECPDCREMVRGPDEVILRLRIRDHRCSDRH